MKTYCCDCPHPLEMHKRQPNGAYRCGSFGCGCEVATVEATPDRELGDDDGVEYADPRDARDDRED